MTVLLEPASGTQFVEGALQVVGVDGASAVAGSGDRAWWAIRLTWRGRPRDA